jgi:predicted RNase H-like nuclease (RuvC/YqgF family)
VSIDSQKDLFSDSDLPDNYEDDSMWEKYKYRPGERGDYNIEISSSIGEPSYEELKNENSVLKQKIIELQKENKQLISEVERLKKNT